MKHWITIQRNFWNLAYSWYKRTHYFLIVTKLYRKFPTFGRPLGRSSQSRTILKCTLEYGSVNFI
jgi:hypothetical protein